MNNWAPNNLGYLASSLGTSVAPFPISITDEDDSLRENCVSINGGNGYVDYNCECARLPFLCQGSLKPPCDQDLMKDEIKQLMCDPTYEAPQCPDDCYTENCKCGDPTTDENPTIDLPSTLQPAMTKTLTLISNECMNWVEAQRYCCENHNG